MREAQIEDIADAVGINRAIVYRHFTGKEELFALTLVGYLDELREAHGWRPTRGARASPTARLTAAGRRRSSTTAPAHPAFVDCAQSLMRRRGKELLAGTLLDLNRGHLAQDGSTEHTAYVVPLTAAARNVPQAMSMGTSEGGKSRSTARLVRSQVA